MSIDASSPKPTRRRIIIIATLALLLSCGACGICAVVSALLSDRDRPSVAPTAERVSATESADQAVEATAGPTTEPAPQSAPTKSPPTQPPPTDQSAVIATAADLAAPRPEPTSTPLQPATQTPAADTGIFRELRAEELALRATLDDLLGESNRGLGRKLNLFGPGLAANSIVIGWAADGAASNALIREGMQRDTLDVLQTVVASGIEYGEVGIGSQYLMANEQLDISDEMEVLTLSYQQDTLQSIDWETVTPNEIWSLADIFVIDPLFEE